MTVIRVDGLLHLLRKGGRVIAAERAQPRSRTGNDVPGSRSRIPLAFLRLIDAERVDDKLNLRIDLVDILQPDSRNLDPLAVCDVNDTISILFGDLHDASQGLAVNHAARNPDPGSRFTADLGIAEGIFLQFCDIDI